MSDLGKVRPMIQKGMNVPGICQTKKIDHDAQRQTQEMNLTLYESLYDSLLIEQRTRSIYLLVPFPLQWVILTPLTGFDRLLCISQQVLVLQNVRSSFFHFTSALHCTPLSLTALITESTSRSLFLTFALRVLESLQGIFLFERNRGVHQDRSGSLR